MEQTARKLLLIENNLEYLQTMTEFFTEWGYEVSSATTFVAASELLAAREADLAVIDIRLRDDSDEKDESGLALAKQYGATLPIVILTNYPTWELVRKALGPTLKTLPPAVDFVYKKDGLSTLLLVIETNLAKLHPLFKSNLLAAFNAPPEANLRQQIRSHVPEESARRLETSFDKTATELAQQRLLEQQNATRWRNAVWFFSGLSMVLVLIMLVALFFDKTDASQAAGLASLFIMLFNILMIRREREANRRVQQLFKELADINEEIQLLVFTQIFEDPEQRELYQQKALNQILLRRTHKRGPAPAPATEPVAAEEADEGGKTFKLTFKTDAELTLPEEE